MTIGYNKKGSDDFHMEAIRTLDKSSLFVNFATGEHFELDPKLGKPILYFRATSIKI